MNSPSSFGIPSFVLRVPHHFLRTFGLGLLMSGSPMLGIENALFGQGPKQPSKPERLTDKQVKFFESQVRPILVERCYACHSTDSGLSEGGLRVDSRVAIRKGGTSGPAVVPGDAKKSLLVRAIRYEDHDIAMPPEDSGGKLSTSEIETLEKWVREGAPDPREESEAAKDPYRQAKEWWAFQPIREVKIPQPVDRSWCYNDIDRFIRVQHEAKGLKPVRDAQPDTLLRRVYFDVIGLPPTPAEIADFHRLINEKKTTSAAIAQVIDSLLSSDQFGMQWGRHWLDVARYAESTGRDVNVAYPHAWRYRDYVVEAWNKNMPYNQFLKEQIAGDLLPAKSPEDRTRQTIATGFLAIGSKSINERNSRQFAVDLADEQIDATFQAAMGLTVACARCHDHKFDPIPQRDYTAIAGIFLSTETKFGTTGGPQGRNFGSLAELPHGAPLASPSLSKEQVARMKKTLDESKKELEEAIQERRSAKKNDNAANPKLLRLTAQISALEGELKSHEANGEPKALAMSVGDKSKPAAGRSGNQPPSRMGAREPKRPVRFRGGVSGFETISDSPLFVRGDIETATSPVPRGLLTMFDSSAKVKIPAGMSGRKQLAEWIVSSDNPMTARVAVNRIWYWIFGQGLVPSLDNFGSTGATAANQDLLDFLAKKYFASGWDNKALIRDILQSHTYQLSCEHHEANLVIDPDNQWNWRANRRRLGAEEIRDAMLSAAGTLDARPQLGSLVARSGDGLIGGNRMRGIPEEQIVGADSNARSIYLPLARGLAPEILETFDLPDASAVQTAREATNVPSQSLFMLNSKFVEKQSRELAKRILEAYPGKTTNDHAEQRIKLAYDLAFARSPSDQELAMAKELADKVPNRPLLAWTSLCRALFATAEFRYLD